jgi:hypothetical protein
MPALQLSIADGLFAVVFLKRPSQKTTAHAKRHRKRPPPVQKTTAKDHRPPQKTTGHGRSPTAQFRSKHHRHS